MTSKFSNKYPIPEKFPEILHDFAREVVRYMPKDILDFAIQYFFYLEQNVPFNYMEGGSNVLPKLTISLGEKEKAKEARENMSTPSYATNQNTQNMFYGQNTSMKVEKEIEKDKEIPETNSSKGNTPLETEGNKTDTNRTNGSGIVGLSKNFVGDMFAKSKQQIREAETLDRNIGNNNERHMDTEVKSEKFNKSGTTFSNISANTNTKNEVRNFVGDVFEESKRKNKQ